jgi:hypothetical protein
MTQTVLGALLISLKADTTAFSKGLKDAQKMCVDSSADIVSSLGKITTQLAKTDFSNLANAGKSLGILGGIAAGVSVAVVGAMVEMTKSTAEHVKQMDKMAQSYGLSIGQVSAMRVAAKLSGVEVDVMAMGMGRLARAAFQVTTSGNYTGSAFQRLGISMADVSAASKGDLSPLLEQIADRFAKMADGTAKTALSMQLFGRSGAAMIPWMNQGSEGIREYTELAKRLGLVWDEETGRAALKFAHTMDIQELKMTALKEQMAQGLLPSLGKLSDAFVNVDRNGNSMAKSLGEAVGTGLIKAAEAVDTAVTGFRQLYLRLKDIDDLLGVLGSGSGKGIMLGLPSYLGGNAQRNSEYDKVEKERSARQATAEFDPREAGIAGMFSFAGQGKSTKTGAADVSAVSKKDPIAERIAHLKDQAEEEGKLAASYAGLTSETVKATAAAEAERVIHDLNSRTGKDVKKVTDDQAKSIHEATLEFQTYKFALNLDKELTKAIEKTREHISAVKDESAAYGKGGDAMAAAMDSAKLAPFVAKQLEAKKALDDLMASSRASVDAIRLAAAAYNNASDALAKYTDQIHQERGAEQVSGTRKLTVDLSKDISDLKAYGEALRTSSQALRELAINKQMYTYQQNPNVTQGDAAAYRAQLEHLSALELANQAYSNTRTAAENYAKELTDLKERHDALKISNEEYQRSFDKIRISLIGSYDPQVRYNQAYRDYLNLKEQDAKLKAAGGPGVITPEADREMQRKLQEQKIQASVTSTSGAGTGMMAGMKQFAMEWQGWGKAAQSSTMQMLNGMQNAFSGFFTSIIMGTKTLGQAFAGLGLGLLNSMVKALSDMVAKWIVTHMVMAAVHAIFKTQEVTTDATATAVKLAATNAANVAMAASFAAVWAAAAASSVAGIPIVGPILAPIAAGTGYAQGMVYAGLASAAGGMDVFREQLVHVHPREMILPAHIAENFRAASPQRALAAAGAGGHTFNFHNYGVSSPDAVAAKVMGQVRTFFKTGGTFRG